eukprot:8653394-Pyramimonas_sp.AAC.1
MGDASVVAGLGILVPGRGAKGHDAQGAVQGPGGDHTLKRHHPDVAEADAEVEASAQRVVDHES